MKTSKWSGKKGESMIPRYRIEWIPKGENFWEDTFQDVEDIANAKRVAKAWRMGMFTYEPPKDVRIFDRKENMVVEFEEGE